MTDALAFAVGALDYWLTANPMPDEIDFRWGVGKHPCDGESYFIGVEFVKFVKAPSQPPFYASYEAELDFDTSTVTLRPLGGYVTETVNDGHQSVTQVWGPTGRLLGERKTLEDAQLLIETDKYQRRMRELLEERKTL